MGRSAAAAIRELSMSVLPATWSVAPAVSMIANATKLLSAMPIQVSRPIRLKAAAACSGASVSFSRRGCSRSSSASWDDCQKYARACPQFAELGRRSAHRIGS